MKKEYLGDGVYAEYDDFGVWLTTENGYAETNKIYLEPRTLEILNLVVSRWRQTIESGGKEAGTSGPPQI